MGVEHLIDMYSPIGDMLSFISCVILLLVIHWVLYFAEDRKFSFLKKAVHYILVGTLANVMFYLVCQNHTEKDWLIFGLRDIYHLCISCTMYLFLLYMKKMLDVDGPLVRFVTHFTRLIFLLALIADFISPVTHLGFYKEGDLWYDPIVSPYNGFYIYSMILLFAILVGYARRLNKSVRYCLIASEVILSGVMTVGALKNTNTFTSFTYVLPIFVVMILLHSKPFDDKTGALSSDSFDSYINQAIRRRKHVDYMVLKLELGSENVLPDELGKILNSFWYDSFRDAVLFSLERDFFVLAIPRDSKNGDAGEKIQHLFNVDFHKHYAKYQLRYRVIGLYGIDFLTNESDLRNMINYLLYTMEENSILFVDDKMRDQLRLFHSIRENLQDIEDKNDLNDSRVLAYCQPIKNMQTGKFDTAEALMRLTLPNTGFVMPYLFIPLAEYYGHIHSLTKVMLNKVCQQISQLEEEGYEFERISINIAASEIKSDVFCEEILDIIKKNKVSPEKIGIEITESQNEFDFNIAKERMRTLREAGMTLYLDDVGTGYSNLDRIVKYDVDVVKFDRFFLVESEKDEKVVRMMKHLSEAFKDLNYKLLYEGVENEDNENICVACGADYIQGFKYSKPVPAENLREFFERK